MMLVLSMSGCADVTITGASATGGRGDEAINEFGNFYERDERVKRSYAPYGYIHGIGYNVGLGIKIKGEF